MSAFEFYTLLTLLFLDIGMVYCEVDHGVFLGRWTSLDLSVPMPSSGCPLVIYIPIQLMMVWPLQTPYPSIIGFYLS